MNNERLESLIKLRIKQINDCYEITEKDFYPPEDKRVFQSGIEDIDGGDNFADYIELFYDNYENEIFDN